MKFIPETQSPSSRDRGESELVTFTLCVEKRPKVICFMAIYERDVSAARDEDGVLKDLFTLC